MPTISVFVIWETVRGECSSCGSFLKRIFQSGFMPPPQLNVFSDKLNLGTRGIKLGSNRRLFGTSVDTYQIR